jgi:hypothetical protein
MGQESKHGGRNLDNEKLYASYFSSHITRMLKSRRVRRKVTWLAGVRRDREKKGKRETA